LEITEVRGAKDMLRVNAELVPYLLSQPEYRMGYQKVVATLDTGGTENGIIVNTKLFLKEGEIPWHTFVDWDSALAQAAQSRLWVVKAKLIPREPETLHGVREVFWKLAERKRLAANSAFGTSRDHLLAEGHQMELIAKGSGAEDAPVTTVLSEEIFKRFSAFKNDRRVTKGMGLAAGTFATTKHDADTHVKTGTDAVQRYALPNPTPASNVFTITPPQNSSIQRGVTQPANNQPGGGVEVIFVNGLPDGTVTGPTTIPDK
jgi:hypothetical protein